jgi:hypothetical protein
MLYDDQQVNADMVVVKEEKQQEGLLPFQGSRFALELPKEVITETCREMGQFGPVCPICPSCPIIHKNLEFYNKQSQTVANKCFVLNPGSSYT